jgi:hypothetical protein
VSQVHDINRCNAAVDVARIYGLVCPVAGCVRYIGKATDPERRLAAHLSSARTGRTKYHHGRWLRKLLADGLSPSVVVLFTVHGDGMTWQQAERFFIASANAFGLPLTNATRGGEGLSLTNPDAALAVSTALRTAWQREDVRAKHSAAMKASHADPAVQAKRAATRVVSDPLRLAASTLGHRTPESRARALASTSARFGRNPNTNSARQRQAKRHGPIPTRPQLDARRCPPASVPGGRAKRWKT